MYAKQYPSAEKSESQAIVMCGVSGLVEKKLQNVSKKYSHINFLCEISKNRTETV